MNSYILLRNNKESGPFTLEALQQTGLQSTDLIWVECQSMSWRYPYEIPELKKLLPENNDVAADKGKQQLSEDVPKAVETIVETAVEKKLVFVELPAGVTPVSKQNIILPVTEKELTDIHKYSGITNFSKPSIEETTSDVNIKYSRPLDEIKEMYVKSLEQKAGRQKHFTFKLDRKYRQAAVYAGLVLMGAAAMLLINTTRSGKETVAKQNINQPIITPDTITEPVSIVPEQVDAIIPVETEQQEFSAANTALTITEEKGKKAPIKKAIPGEKGENLPANHGTDKTVKNSQSADEVMVPKPATVENISSKLTIQANAYSTGSFGGIRNLEMTLQNNSKYLLDKVTVELEYLNPEGIILKTENIYFQSVHSGEKETVAVKKSKRGVKIAYKITKVESKDISSSTAGL